MVLRDSIFKIACRLIEKMLVIEVKKMQPSNMLAIKKQQAESAHAGCLRIVTNEVFIKSVLIYAVQTYFYLTNQNELSFREQLQAI